MRNAGEARRATRFIALCGASFSLVRGDELLRDENLVGSGRRVPRGARLQRPHVT